MQTPKIVNFTVMATVGVAFLQQQLSDDTASRVRQFEQIVAACAAVLQFLGRPRFLDSLFQLWSGLTHSLILMEALLFPEQPVQTSSQLALPRENLPLSSIMDDRFQQWAPLIPLAIQSLAEHTDWFHEKYDKNLHKEMAALWTTLCYFSKAFTKFCSYGQTLQLLLMLHLTQGAPIPPLLSSSRPLHYPTLSHLLIPGHRPDGIQVTECG